MWTPYGGARKEETRVKEEEKEKERAKAKETEKAKASGMMAMVHSRVGVSEERRMVSIKEEKVRRKAKERAKDGVPRAGARIGISETTDGKSEEYGRAGHSSKATAPSLGAGSGGTRRRSAGPRSHRDGRIDSLCRSGMLTAEERSRRRSRWR